jgi:hypothetical protein
MRTKKRQRMTMSSNKKQLIIKANADMSGQSNGYIEGLKRYIRTVFSMSPYGVKDVDFETVEEAEPAPPSPSEPYRSMISSSLYNELVEEQELTIIGAPYTIDEGYDLTLIPVDNGFDLDTQFALCDYKDLLVLLAASSIEKIKAFNVTPYKQGSDDE